MKENTNIDPRLTIIAAVAENGAIGYNNNLIYRLPRDLRRFKTLTTGNTVIMGRRTFDSLPHGALPDRRNIVLSRRGAYCPGCEVYGSLEEALQHCGSDERIFIIGGATLYRAAIGLAATLCLTIVRDTPTNADTFFPAYADGQWTETAREDFSADDKHKFDFSFVDYKRK